MGVFDCLIFCQSLMKGIEIYQTSLIGFKIIIFMRSSYISSIMQGKTLLAVFLIVTLVKTLSVASPTDQHNRWHFWYSSNITLNFQYACNEDADLEDCKFMIQWNGKVLKEITPEDYNIHVEELVFTGGGYGKNIVKFTGLGSSAEVGIGLANIQMTRDYHKFRNVIPQYLLNNSDFEEGHHVGDSWQTFQSLGPWKGKEFQIGSGPLYSSLWDQHIHICQLTSNNSISQNIYFGRRHLLISEQSYQKFSQLQKQLDLVFVYAAKMNTSLPDNKFTVLWNGKVLKEITPQNYSKNRASLKFRIEPDQKNTLTFRGNGENPEFGAAIDQLSIRRKFSLFTKNHQKHSGIVNGWFQDERFLISKEETIFDNGMNGWRGNPIKIVISTYFNINFDSSNINHLSLCELAGSNQIHQDFFFDKDYNFKSAPLKKKNNLILGFSYAADPNLTLFDSKFAIKFNREVVDEISPSDYKKHYRTYEVEGKIGDNSVHFTGKGQQDGKGVGITYVTLKRSSKQFKPFNLIGNDKFMIYNKGCSNNSWKGEDINPVPGKTYNHSWDWESRACVCPLGSNSDIYQQFQLDNNFQYVSSQQHLLPLWKKKSLELQFGFFPQEKVPLSGSKFSIEWNGKVVKQIITNNYKQLQQSVKFEARIGTNTLRLIGSGDEEGKGGAFNYIRLHRYTNLFNPYYLRSSLFNVAYDDPCPMKLPFWKGSPVAIIKGTDFSLSAFTCQCLVQLKKGEEIRSNFEFNQKYQSQ